MILWLFLIFFLLKLLFFKRTLGIKNISLLKARPCFLIVIIFVVQSRCRLFSINDKYAYIIPQAKHSMDVKTQKFSIILLI